MKLLFPVIVVLPLNDTAPVPVANVPVLPSTNLKLLPDVTSVLPLNDTAPVPVANVPVLPTANVKLLPVVISVLPLNDTCPSPVANVPVLPDANIKFFPDAISVSLSSETFPVPVELISTFSVPKDLNCNRALLSEADGAIYLAYKLSVNVVPFDATINLSELPIATFTLPVLPLLRVAVPLPLASIVREVLVDVVTVGVAPLISLICNRGDARTFPVISNPERSIPFPIVLVEPLVQFVPNTVVPVAPRGSAPLSSENRIPCNQPLVPVPAPI